MPRDSLIEIRDHSPIVYHVPETALAPHPLGSPLVNLFPSEMSQALTFSTKCKECEFGVECQSGQISLDKSTLDYESNPQYWFNVTVKSNQFLSWTHTIPVLIKVDDVIDEPPIFEHSSYRVSIERNFPIGTKILTFNFSDSDQNDCHKLNIATDDYEDLHDEFFSIDHSTNSLVLSNSLREVKPDSIELWVIAIDLSGLSGATLVYIDLYYKLLDGYGERYSTHDDGAAFHGGRYSRQTNGVALEETRIQLTWENQSYLLDSKNSSSSPLTIHLIENLHSGSEIFILELLFESGDILKLNLFKDNFTLGSGTSNCSEQFTLTHFVIEEQTVPFMIDKNDNVCQHILTNTDQLDYENLTEYSLTIQATFDRNIIPYTAHIRVLLNDQNDNSPKFSSALSSLIFLENFTGTIGQIQASDADGSMEFGKLTYSIVGGSGYFRVTGDGSIEVLQTFDYEFDEACYYFNLSAVDGGGLEAFTLVEACLVDVNDNCPKFEEESYDFFIPENNPINLVLLNLTAIDTDSSSEYSTIVNYKIEPIHMTSYFRLDTFEKVLTIRTSLDYDVGQRFFTFQIITSDSGDNVCSTNITVNVLNVKDLPPVFGFDFRQLRIPEETYPYQSSKYSDNILECVRATDPEDDNITYSLANPSDYFVLLFEPDGSVCLKLLKAFDYESQRRFEVEITATDGSVFAESAFIIIDVANLNDLEFKVQEIYVVQVREEFKDPFPILNITIEDPTPQAVYRFELEQGDELFTVTSSGSVIMLSSLDYETRSKHAITIRITDRVNVAISQVEIQVIPVNEYPPVFLFHDIRRAIQENTRNETLIYKLMVLDRDMGHRDPVIYELEYITIDGEPVNSSLSHFTIIQPAEGEMYGKLLTAIEFDYETHPREYVMHIYASDGLFRSNPLTLTVFIEDVNDFRPEFSQNEYTFMISEDQDNVEIRLAAIDQDGSRKYNLVTSYVITSLEPPNSNAPFYGSGGYIRNTQRFNFERPPNLYKITLTASDDYGLSSSTNITFIIQDANEFAPIF